MTGYNIEIHSWLQGLGNKLLLKEITLSFRNDIYILVFSSFILY